MKQIIIILLTLGMFSNNVSAQTRKTVRKTTTQSKPATNPKPKDSREYQVGDDGFEWYKVCKNGKFGAEDRNGNILVPTEYNKIEYQDFIGKGFCAKKGEYYSFYNPNGQCVIPFSRKYTNIVKVTKDNDPDIEKMMCQPFGTWYNCQKEGGFSVLCDINGKEVCKIPTQSIGQLDIPHYAQGRFYWQVGVWDKNIKDYRYGILDGNGNVIIEPMLGLHLFPDSKGNFNDEAGNAIANLSSITTTKNPLGNNPYENVSSNSSSSNTSQSSSSNSLNSNSGNKTTTVVVEHHHDPVPMTEWVPCGVCGHNPGVCQTCLGMRESASGRPCISCRGTGNCHFCNGKGGRYQTVYR